MNSQIAPVAAGGRSDGFWRLVAAGEPFRILFPVGTAIGVVGVALWPLYAWNLTSVYPGLMHARIMIEGFLTAFVIGFLGTALPRLLEVPRLSLAETLGFAGAVIFIACLHVSGNTFWGDQVFFLTLLALICALGMRALMFRKDVPPPAFLLVALGLGCAVFGSAVQFLACVSVQDLPDWAVPLSRRLLYQGYIVFPIMGVGAFLLPRFFELPSRQSFPESLALPPGWLARAGFALFCGGVVLAGFLLESLGELRLGNGLRAGGIGLYFAREVPFHRVRTGGGSIAFGLRLALLSLPVAYALMAAWPARSLSFLHLLFISGFSLLTFLVASRVVLGHSGQSEKFRATLWPVLVLTAFVSLAMLTRVSADWMPSVRLTHYAYAALTWAAGVLIWAACILPGVRRPDSES